MNGSLADNHAGCYHTAHCGLCLVAESCILSLHAETGREARMMRPKSCAGYQDLRTEHVVESSREELIFWIPFDVFKLILRDELPHHHTGPVPCARSRGNDSRHGSLQADPRSKSYRADQIIKITEAGI